jgi:hypothetical protein
LTEIPAFFENVPMICSRRPEMVSSPFAMLGEVGGVLIEFV